MAAAVFNLEYFFALMLQIIIVYKFRFREFAYVMQKFGSLPTICHISYGLL
jgi:hypothetical protein